MHNLNNHTTTHLRPVFVQERVPVQEEQQKQIMACEMTNTIQLTTHTYYMYTAWSSPFNPPMNLLNTSIHLSLS